MLHAASVVNTGELSLSTTWTESHSQPLNIQVQICSFSVICPVIHYLVLRSAAKPPPLFLRLHLQSLSAHRIWESVSKAMLFETQDAAFQLFPLCPRQHSKLCTAQPLYLLVILCLCNDWMMNGLNFLFYVGFAPTLHLDLGPSGHYLGFRKLNQLLPRLNNFPVCMVVHHKRC